MSRFSRRGILRFGGVGLGASLAGCSTVDRYLTTDPELYIVVWNHDMARGHQMRLEFLDPDVDDREEARITTEDLTLKKAADTESGAEFNDRSQRELTVESRPYLLRVFGEVGQFANNPAHYHFRPCHSDTEDVIDRLFVNIYPPDVADGFSTVTFEDPC